MGNLSALTGSCIWLFLATFLSLLVSATHSIVGATIGFSLVAQGAKGVGWVKLGLIIASWFVSPVMSGIITVVLFIFIKKLVLTKAKPLEPGLRLLPLFYGVTILINALSIFLDGSELLHFDKIPLWGGFILSIGLAVITAVAVRILVVPWMRNRIGKQMEEMEKEDIVRVETGKDDATERLCVKTYGDLEIEVKDDPATTDTSFTADKSSHEKTLHGNGAATSAVWTLDMNNRILQCSINSICSTEIPMWGGFILSIGLAVITVVAVRILVVPWTRKRVGKQMEEMEKEDIVRVETGKDDATERLCVKTYGDLEIEVKDDPATTDTSFTADKSSHEKTLHGNGAATWILH